MTDNEWIELDKKYEYQRNFDPRIKVVKLLDSRVVVILFQDDKILYNIFNNYIESMDGRELDQYTQLTNTNFIDFITTYLSNHVIGNMYTSNNIFDEVITPIKLFLKNDTN